MDEHTTKRTRAGDEETNEPATKIRCLGLADEKDLANEPSTSNSGHVDVESSSSSNNFIEDRETSPSESSDGVSKLLHQSYLDESVSSQRGAGSSSKTTHQGEIAQIPSKANLIAVLKSPTTSWNDSHAHQVYKAFMVKRYFVCYENILDPLGHEDLKTVSDILDTTDWSQLEEKLQPLFLHQHSCYQTMPNISEGLVNYEVCKAAMERTNLALIEVGNLIPKDCSEAYVEWFSFLDEVFQYAFEVLRRNDCIEENTYKDIIENILRLLQGLGFGFSPTIRTVSIRENKLNIPGALSEHIRPDLFIMRKRPGCTILAVVGVKVPDRKKFPDHKGHRLQRKEMTTSGSSSQSLTSNPSKKNESEDLDCEMDEGDENDRSDIAESEMEKQAGKSLPSYMRYLYPKEKKQVRRFLPQLFGQMLSLAKSTTPTPGYFRQRYAPRYIGLEVMGFKVRFVTLVIEDKKRKLPYPCAADIVDEKNKYSVKPSLFITEEFNLFKKDELRTFCKILYALSKA